MHGKRNRGKNKMSLKLSTVVWIALIMLWH